MVFDYTEQMKTMKLKSFWDEDMGVHGIYALWQVKPLPNIGNLERVVGINHCTAIYNTSSGFDVPDDSWVHDANESEVCVKLLEVLDDEDW